MRNERALCAASIRYETSTLKAGMSYCELWFVFVGELLVSLHLFLRQCIHVENSGMVSVEGV